MPQLFPFSAIVGQDDLKRALVLNAVRPDIGGVLVRGERGTAKSTAARGLAALLPPIRAVVGCPYACDPARTAQLCERCSALLEDGLELPSGLRPTPFVDLPVSATEDRVVGTLDIEHVLATGERRFEPGVLAAANRGLLYIDEVNLLDDHVVDVLLDAAAMGVNIVEREGVSFSHPARFILVGTMNPEEGELRPQLTDRFGLAVTVGAVHDVGLRTEILRRRLAYDDGPDGFMARWSADESALREQILAARDRLGDVVITDGDLHLAARLVAAAGVDGHRAEIAILKAAQANAAFEGRTAISVGDMALAARLALPHRQRRGPLEGGSSDMVAVHEVLAQADRATLEPAQDGLTSLADGQPQAGRGDPLAPDADGPKSGGFRL